MADDLRLFLEMKNIRATRATLPMRFSRWLRRNSRWVAELSAVAGKRKLDKLKSLLESASPFWSRQDRNRIETWAVFPGCSKRLRVKECVAIMVAMILLRGFRKRSLRLLEVPHMQTAIFAADQQPLCPI